MKQIQFFSVLLFSLWNGATNFPAQAAPQQIVKAFVGDIQQSSDIKHGNIYLVDSAGRKTKVTSDGNCSKPRIAPDGQTVGWRHGEFIAYRNLKPTPYWETSLVFYRGGRVLSRFGPFENRSLIGEWEFQKGSRQAALRRYGMHGQPVYQLCDVRTSRTLALWEEWQDGKPQKMPRWAKTIKEK